MSYVVKKPCLLCRKVLDKKDSCTNPDCIMSKVPDEETKENSK